MTKIPTKEGEIIKEHIIPSAVQGNNETVDLVKMQILGEFGMGQYVILPKGMHILNKIYSLLHRYITEPIKFSEVVLPKVAGVETFKRASLLEHWGSFLLAISPYSDTEGIEDKKITDPLQCTVFYQYLEGRTVDVSGGPIKWYDRSGPTYRNENLNNLLPGVRQYEFHRAEFIYLGTNEQVIETREQCLNQLEQLCNDLGLGYRVVVGAGCHRLREDEISVPNSLEEIQIKDVEVYCPGYGFLEVSGNSALGNVLTSRFSITGNKGERLSSGCSGLGLDRMIYAIVANYGVDKLPELIS